MKALSTVDLASPGSMSMASGRRPLQYNSVLAKESQLSRRKSMCPKRRLLSSSATVIAFGVAALVSRAHAWGAAGHEAVCQIGFLELSSAEQASVNKILEAETDPQFKEFFASCEWPDQVGPVQTEHRPEHFINLPRSATSLHSEECPESDVCLFTAIRRDESVASVKSDATPTDRLIALKFLGHWIGDIHQPLHISYEDDRGGNEILLSSPLGCRNEMHDVWDTCIPNQLMQEMGAGTDRKKFGTLLHDGITDQNRKEWLANLSPVAWANESYAIAVVPDVQYCTMKGTSCCYETRPDECSFDADQFEKRVVTLTAQYEADHRAIVKQRLQQAGVRLGAILRNVVAVQ